MKKLTEGSIQLHLLRNGHCAGNIRADRLPLARKNIHKRSAHGKTRGLFNIKKSTFDERIK